MDPFLGEVKLFPYQKNMVGWLPCDGRLLQINQYQALASLLGNAFGGDSRTTFGLPDLRGRTPVSIDYRYPTAFGRGIKSGQETVPLASNTSPAHTHAFQVTSTAGTVNIATGNFYASVGKNTAGDQPPLYATPGTGTSVSIDPTSLQTSGSSQAHNNMQPYLVLAYYIATIGIYPSRP